MASSEFRKWVSTQPCVVCGMSTYHEKTQSWHTDPAHVQSKGSGGDEVGNIVPLDRPHHVEMHMKGKTAFEEKHGIDLKKEAERIADKWLAGNTQNEE